MRRDGLSILLQKDRETSQKGLITFIFSHESKQIIFNSCERKMQLLLDSISSITQNKEDSRTHFTLSDKKQTICFRLIRSENKHHLYLYGYHRRRGGKPIHFLFNLEKATYICLSGLARIIYEQKEDKKRESSI